MITEDSLTGLEIAVIGMAGRFPGARNVNEFWNNVTNGVESISFFSDEELEEAGISIDMANHANYIRGLGILEDIQYFDSLFFGYAPIEAEVMDPQIRIFHECAWHALENAGYNPGTYKGSIGIYAGATPHFSWEALTLISGKNDEIGAFMANHLNIKDFMPLRVSHALNLKGPSFSMYTACSTSLVSIHLACQALLSGECDMAMAGGITVTILDKGGYIYQEGVAKSRDGHCRAFDAKSTGTTGGNGVGIVVLKRLEEALADNDHIYAMVKGSAVNNDGNKKVGFSAPSVQGQVEAIQAAQVVAEVEPESISYIETHGTGTQLGDPIEIEALKLAFNLDKKGVCGLGSVKTNMGHTDSAAGVAGFIKTVLALKHKVIPPSLHFESPNPKLGLENTPFYVNNQLKEWKNNGYPLRAAVSSFGIGGTNAHVILEEVPQGIGRLAPLPIEPPSRRYQLILLSAKTPSALERMTANLAEFFKENPGIHLADAAYTLQVGRGAFNHRRMLPGENIEKVAAALASPAGENLHTNSLKVEKRPVVFMFSGQGSEYVNMGLQLYREEKAFKEEIDRCFDILEQMGYHIKDILYPRDNVEEAQEKINRIVYSFPIKFAVEYAAARLLIKWGIKPYAMMGPSFGEYIAACLSGVFTLEDALFIVVARGKLIDSLPKGAMLNVPLPENQLKPLLNQDIELASVNSTSHCVVSGTEEAIRAFEKQLNEKGYECGRLRVPRAGHSKMMDPILEELEKKAGQIKLNPPKIPYISGVTGKWITLEQATDPHYWARHSRETMRFYDGLNQLFEEENSIFVQVGSDRSLSTLVELHPDKKPGNLVINLLRHPKDEVPDVKFLLHKIGMLWLYGKEADWEAFYHGQTRYRVPLPTYSFDNLIYKTGGDPFKIAFERFSALSWSSRKEMADWFYVPTWTRSRLPVDFGESGELSEKHHWLLFIDEWGLGFKIKSQLEQMGHHVVSVRAGKGFHKEGNRDYTIDPQRETDYLTLVKELFSGDDKNITRIVHLWGVSDEHEGTRSKPLEINRIDKALQLGLFSLVYFAKALGTGSVTRDLEIEVITNNMQDVGGEEFLCPEKSTVLGAVKVIPLEFSNMNCRSIDITLPNPGSPQEVKLIKQLLAEFTEETFIRVLAYRGNERWEQTLDPLRLEKPNETGVQLKEKGVYLITGGLSGIGLELAAYLAGKVKAKLILIARSAFPARKNWEKWLESHEKDDTTSTKIRSLQELEQLGAEVLVFSADVTDQNRMREVVARAKKRFGPTNGVIHAAGVRGGGSIQLKTREMLEKDLAAKVKGTLVLDSVLEDIPLDFFILCSSGNALVPIFGQVDYCAANAFLDAFANYNTLTQGKFTQSINWNRWKNTGMAVEVERKHKENTGTELSGGISAQEGVEAFHRILPKTIPQVVVSESDIRIDIESRKQRPKAQIDETPVTSGAAEAKEETPPPVTLHPRPPLSTPYAAPGNEKEEKLVEIFQNFFGIEKPGINDDFFELGGDSLKALSIVNRIKKEVNPNITLSDLLLHPTIKELLESKREQSILDHLECIVKLNQGKNKKNIFLVHPRHGMVYQYKDLAKLLEDDFNVYAIQARGLLKMSKLPQNFEVAAADYIKQMRQVQEQGPYIIGAFCIGDMIAYNIVRQLEEINQTVEKFIMLDEFAFIPPGVATYFRQKKIVDLILKPLKKLSKKSDTKARELEKMLEEIEKDGVKNKYNKTIDEEEAELLKARVKQNFGVLIADYTNRSPFKRIQGIIKAPILNIKAEETFMEIVQKNIRKMTLGTAEFDAIPGEHDTMFQYPYVLELAEVIRRAFKNTNKK